MSFLRQYLVAVRFFTRVPVTGSLAAWVGSSPDTTRASGAHFPGVGWLVGIVACAAFALIGLSLPDSPFAAMAAAVGCTIATLMLTGAVHENGLARIADGLGTGVPAQRALEIMKDSRIGSYGVLALILALLAKVSLLAVLAAQSPVAVLAALLSGHVISRFWPLLLGRGMTYLGEPGPLGHRLLAERLGSRDLGIAAAWAAVALAFAWLVQGLPFALLALGASGIALLWMRRLLARRLQGFTDDSLGAAQQVCEIAFYLGAAVGVGLR